MTLLGTSDLASVALWADDIRGARPETYNWHFVDIPKNQTTYDPMRDCQPGPRGDCVIAEIARARAVLADKTAASAARAEALRFLIHFYGDMHQPLHCADNMDRGGNGVVVTWFGQVDSSPAIDDKPATKWNLHSVWDFGIIDRVNMNETQWVASLKAALANGSITVPAGSTPITWAQAAHALAVSHAYDTPASLALGQPYQDRNLPIVRRQLARAAVRLANALNELIGT
jgi:S1/P1 Nuclease